MCSCKTCGILAKTFPSRKDAAAYHVLAATYIGNNVERAGNAAKGAFGITAQVGFGVRSRTTQCAHHATRRAAQAPARRNS
jgi:hypothetical protein